jgi:hypothetical protein
LGNGSSPVPHVTPDIKEYLDICDHDSGSGGWTDTANPPVTRFLVMQRHGNGGVQWVFHAAANVPDYCTTFTVSAADAAIMESATVDENGVSWEDGAKSYLLFAHYADGEAVLVEQ